MSNIAGLFHPWEREPERGGWRAGAARGRSADPSASLHPRLSATLIFLHGPRSIIPRHIRPLSSLFPPTSPSASSSRLPASNSLATSYQLLIAVSKFIRGALVRRFARSSRTRKELRVTREGVGLLLWASSLVQLCFADLGSDFGVGDVSIIGRD